jgi:hypothetical protein
MKLFDQFKNYVSVLLLNIFVKKILIIKNFKLHQNNQTTSQSNEPIDSIWADFSFLHSF